MEIPQLATSLITPLTNTAKIQNPTAKSIEDIGQSFEDILSSLNQSQINADNLVQSLAAGEDIDLHQVMIGLEENEVNFKVAMSIRDKLVEAYQEVMRMQV